MYIDGVWTDQTWITDTQGRFQRGKTTFRQWIEPAASATHPAVAKRYHLVVSLACPWACRTLIMRQLKELDDAISVAVVHPDMDAHGWKFAAFPGATRDPIVDAEYLSVLYLAAAPTFTGRITVPVLWDREAGTIVNNESREIMRMFDHAFMGVAGNDHDYAPAAQRAAIDATLDAIYEPINNGVYRCGFAASQAAYDEAVEELFAALDYWDGVLAKQRFLCGDRLSEADIAMFTTLVRFDAVYHVHFKCSTRRIADYPNLWPYLRDLYAQPAFRAATDFDHIRRHYYYSHTSINPKRLIAAMPALDWDTPHGRERLG